MDLSKEYLELVKEFEGYSSTPYLCPAGCVTIGYGTNLEANPSYIPYKSIRLKGNKGRNLLKELINAGMNWTKKKATEVLLDELEKTHNLMLKEIPEYKMLLDANEKIRAEAMLDMAYNMGVYGLKKFEKTRNLIAEKKFEEAAENLKLSKWYKQVGRRSKKICEIFKTGVITPLT